MTLRRDEFTGGTGSAWSPPWVGDRFVAGGYCGGSFDSGLLRFHDSVSGPEAVALIRQSFGDIIDHVGLFAFDWLGRQYGVIDPAQGDGTGPDVVVFDIGLGEVRMVATLAAVWSDIETGAIAEFLEGDAFAVWRREVADGQSLGFTECAGFVHPPFLGGEESIENLERSDISVYWYVLGSLYAQTKDLPEGTVISEVSLKEGG